MHYTIAIDRVGNVNIFNMIKSHSSNDTGLYFNENLHSILEQDLIQEYLHELRNIIDMSRVLVNYTQNKTQTRNSMKPPVLDLNEKLKQIGHTIFSQFFPEQLQDFIKKNKKLSLSFHMPTELASFPLEILHDGDSFLWEKFYIGKNIKDKHSLLGQIIPKDNINMLIIADPTENLEWARKEGEYLYEKLRVNHSDNKLKIHLISGRSITKLNLLNMILDKDIIHYCGHLHYKGKVSENGWILYNYKLIHAHEIQKSGIKPLLIFSNSCFGGSESKPEDERECYSDFASSFLQAGKTCYIGSNWEILDSKFTLEFTLYFYEILLEGNSIGKALQKARIYAKKQFNSNDLTCSSYILMGNPSSKIFNRPGQIPDISDHILEADKVIKEYPYPIAMAYYSFVQTSNKLQDENDIFANREILRSLFNLNQETVFFLCSLILTGDDQLQLSKGENNFLETTFMNYEKTLENIYQVIKKIELSNSTLQIPYVIETMLHHRENLYKISYWQKSFEHDDLSLEEFQSYAITMQYFIESILIEIEYLKNYRFCYFHNISAKQIHLHGIEKYHRSRSILLSTQSGHEDEKEILENIKKLKNKCIFYIPFRKIFLDMSNYIEIDFKKTNQLFKICSMNFRFHHESFKDDQSGIK